MGGSLRPARCTACKSRLHSGRGETGVSAKQSSVSLGLLWWEDQAPYKGADQLMRQLMLCSLDVTSQPSECMRPIRTGNQALDRA